MSENPTNIDAKRSPIHGDAIDGVDILIHRSSPPNKIYLTETAGFTSYLTIHSPSDHTGNHNRDDNRGQQSDAKQPILNRASFPFQRWKRPQCRPSRMRQNRHREV